MSSKQGQVAAIGSLLRAHRSARGMSQLDLALEAGAQVGGAIGVSLIGVLFYGALGGRGAPAATPGAYVHAFSASLPFLMGVGIIVALLVQLLPRKAAEA